MAVNSGELFESYVHYIYQTLLGSAGKNITVARRADVYDNQGNRYNIDVFYEFDVVGVHHRVAVECKDTRRPIERDDVLAFEAKVRNLSNTIGIFISRSGFQSGAKKYLEDHGITHFSGDDMPQFGSVIASRVRSVALPDDSAVGQPFWGLMEVKEGNVTGTWVAIPDRSETQSTSEGLIDAPESSLLPLFHSRPQADRFRRFACSNSDVCVRGIEQPTLQFLIQMAYFDGRKFAICVIVEDEIGNPQMMAQPWSAVDLANEYSTVDLTSRFDKAAARLHKKFSSS